MKTFPYANTTGFVGCLDDGTPIGHCDIEIIDPNTGEQPVDDEGRKLYFIEVNAAEGWAIAYDNNSPGPNRVRVERALEIRLRENAP